uniref:Transcription initiation factor TFIID subunit n=1 Tax=Angiostrongylus cantonensis TaxID=6313 RepID=A0A0K0DFL8_ANGCA
MVNFSCIPCSCLYIFQINVHDVKIQALEGTTQFDSGTASDEDSNVANEEANEVGTKHLNVLKKLKECDPEFYKFLQDEDADLLQFQVSDEDEEEDDGIEHGKTAVGKPSFPKGKKDNSGRIIFDGRMLDYLHDVLDTQDEARSILIEDIRLAVEAFNACVSRVGADIEMPKYVINEQVVLNIF